MYGLQDVYETLGYEKFIALFAHWNVVGFIFKNAAFVNRSLSRRVSVTKV